MSVNTTIVAVTACLFVVLLILSIQQLSLKPKNDQIRSWFLFRLFLTWNILNETIVLGFQLGSSIEYDDNNSSVGSKISASVMRVFVRLNWCITGYLGFGLGVFVYDWMYKHVLLIDEDKVCFYKKIVLRCLLMLIY